MQQISDAEFAPFCYAAGLTPLKLPFVAASRPVTVTGILLV
jgi:hypothetical protein